MFCDIADAWASIWFLARSATSAAKSVPWMREREASIFWVWLVRLDMANRSLFKRTSTLDRSDRLWYLPYVLECNGKSSCFGM